MDRLRPVLHSKGWDSGKSAESLKYMLLSSRDVVQQKKKPGQGENCYDKDYFSAS